MIDNLLRRLLRAWLKSEDLAPLMSEVYIHIEEPKPSLANMIDELIEELENATIQQESD